MSKEQQDVGYVVSISNSKKEPRLQEMGFEIYQIG